VVHTETKDIQHSKITIHNTLPTLSKYQFESYHLGGKKKKISCRSGDRHSASRFDSYSTTIWSKQAAWPVRSGNQRFAFSRA